jgi:hypothetical protein
MTQASGFRPTHAGELSDLVKERIDVSRRRSSPLETDAIRDMITRVLASAIPLVADLPRVPSK